MSEPHAGRGAKHRPHRHNHQRKIQVMQPDLEIGVAKRLQHGDVLALCGNDPRQHCVEQKGRDAEKDGRRDGAHRSEPIHFVRQITVRHLVLAAVCAQAAVRPRQQIEPTEDVGLRSAGHQRERHVVEPAIHVECRREFLVSHPKHAESFVIRNQPARLNLNDVFG